jgi:integrase/recombinase XerD
MSRMNRGYDALRMTRKGGKRDSLAIHPETTQRLGTYLDTSGHGDDLDGPLFRPLRPNGKGQSVRRHLDPNRIDGVLQQYVRQLGLGRGYAAHSRRATFIMTARESGAPLEEVQRTVGHAQPLDEAAVQSTEVSP